MNLAQVYLEEALGKVTVPETDTAVFEESFMKQLYGMGAKPKAKGKRKGPPPMSAEKILEIAERLLAAGNKRMALLWAARAEKAGRAEGKSAVVRRAQEIQKLIREEMAVKMGFYGIFAERKDIKPYDHAKAIDAGLKVVNAKLTEIEKTFKKGKHPDFDLVSSAWDDMKTVMTHIWSARVIEGKSIGGAIGGVRKTMRRFARLFAAKTRK